jgi:signal transduction histidine kinase
MLARAECRRPAGLTSTSPRGRRAHRAWSALADEAGIALAAGPAPTAPVGASLVPGHLEQILDNLLANAHCWSERT